MASVTLCTLQMFLATIALILAAYAAVAFDVHAGYILVWITWTETMIFTVLRVFNRSHDRRSWRVLNLLMEFISIVLWATTTGLLARDGAYLSDARHGPDFGKDYHNGKWEYTGFGKSALYCTYVAAAVTGVILLLFLVTGVQASLRWRAPLQEYKVKDDLDVEHVSMTKKVLFKRYSDSTGTNSPLTR